MITVEEQQIREYLAVDEITFAIPAQSFAISCAISAEEALPVVTEFALRIAYVCGNLSPTQIQEFFGFSKKETDAVIQSLLNERLIQWNEDHLELTSYALARFQDSSDNLPRFFKIQEWSAEVVFDLISFSPAGRTSRLKRVRSQIELATRNLDKQSRTIQFAEQSFQQHFRQICTKEKAEIYKITAIDSGERFSIPLSCSFHLDLSGQLSVQRNIDDESFGGRLEISEAITDALANQERGNNESFREFINVFNDALLDKYISGDTFDLRRYVLDVHLTKVVSYNDDRVKPMLGAVYLQRNAAALSGVIETELATGAQKDTNDACGNSVEEQDASEKLKPSSPVSWDALWWGPQSTLWARSRNARDFGQKLEKLLGTQPKERSAQHGLRVIVPGDRRSARHRFSVYRDQFPRLLGADISVMNGNLELVLVPERVVCAMFHFHLAHQAVAIPIGFLSTHPDHIKAAAALLSRRVMGKRESISAAREDGGQETIESFFALAERLVPMSETKNGRPRLTLKKPL